MANRGTINKTYERKMQSSHTKGAEPQQPGTTSNNTTTNMQREQVHAASLTPRQDEDIDMQLEAITPEHGGSLQLSTSQECPAVNQLQPTNKERRIIHLAENTPSTFSLKSPRTEDTIHTHSAKRRKAVGDEGTATSHSKNNVEGSQGRARHKVPIPSIEIVAQMWFGYPIHEAMAIQRGKPILKET
jgi:hypothetical protein